jgi:hypothetical protein
MARMIARNVSESMSHLGFAAREHPLPGGASP